MKTIVVIMLAVSAVLAQDKKPAPPTAPAVTALSTDEIKETGELFMQYQALVIAFEEAKKNYPEVVKAELDQRQARAAVDKKVGELKKAHQATPGCELGGKFEWRCPPAQAGPAPLAPPAGDAAPVAKRNP
jgi:hypothetical protein